MKTTPRILVIPFPTEEQAADFSKENLERQLVRKESEDADD